MLFCPIVLVIPQSIIHIITQQIFCWIYLLFVEYIFALVDGYGEIHWNRRTVVIERLFAKICYHAVLSLIANSFRVASINFSPGAFFLYKGWSEIWSIIDYLQSWRIVRDWHWSFSDWRLRFILWFFFSYWRKLISNIKFQLEKFFGLRASNQATHLLLVEITSTWLRIFEAQGI